METETKVLIGVSVLALTLIVANYYQTPCYDVCSNPMLDYLNYHKFCVEGSPGFTEDYYTSHLEQLNECRQGHGLTLLTGESK